MVPSRGVCLWAIAAVLPITLGFLPLVGLAQTYGDGIFGANEYSGTSNLPPLISLTMPTSGQSFSNGASVSISASSSDPDGTIAEVAFFVDDVSIGTTSSPYTTTWTAAGTGAHGITAVATDNEGAHATATVAITVPGSSSGGSSGGSSSSGSKSSSSKSKKAEATSAPASIAELQQKVAELTALLAQLMALRDATRPAAPTGFIFTRDLTVGSDHADVRMLQQFLNSKGFTVSTVGAGSPGQESTYFGQLTREALAVFQSTHDIVPAVGYFGPVTRALVTSILKP